MPGRAPAQGGQPRQPFGPQLKAALVQAAPLFSAMAAGYSSGRGPYAYMDQGIAGMQAMQKQKRDEEAAAAAAAAFGGLVPGGMGPAGGGFGGGSSGAYTGTNAPPAPIKADVGIYGGGNGGLSFGLPAADAGSVAKGGLSFGPETGHSGYTRYEAKYGLPEGYLARTAQIESGGDPNAKNPNSSAGGLFQFVDGTAAQYGLENKFDPAQATDAAARLAADNKAYLTRVLGREPTAAELYLAHQQGAGGAAKLLANPNARAVDVVGADAVRLNGGDANMTAGQFASKWTGKFGGGSGASAAASTGPVDPLADPYVQRLMQVMAMPGLTPEQRSVVELQLQTRMGQLSAPNPDADEDRARERRARDAELLGYGRGTPEWNQYVVTGEIPAGFDQDNFTDGAPSGTMWIDPNNRAAGVKAIPGYREPVDDPLAALKARAKEGGLVEGTPEYRTFMINNGPASGMIIESTPDGGIRVVQGDAVAGAKPFTEGQSKDIVYATRAEGALASLDPIANALTSRGEVAADWLPMGLGGGMQTDEYQVAKTAGDEFLQAILRKDTGAAITTQEQALYGETYLPRPGDSPARLQYKQEARKRAVEALKGGMSPAQIIAQEKALEKAGGVVAPSSQPIVTDDGYTIRAIE